MHLPGQKPKRVPARDRIWPLSRYGRSAGSGSSAGPIIPLNTRPCNRPPAFDRPSQERRNNVANANGPVDLNIMSSVANNPILQFGIGCRKANFREYLHLSEIPVFAGMTGYVAGAIRVLISTRSCSVRCTGHLSAISRIESRCSAVRSPSSRIDLSNTSTFACGLSQS